MNIFDRINNKNHNLLLEKINFIDRPFKTKELYFSDLALLHFYVDSKLYFYVIKDKIFNNINVLLTTEQLLVRKKDYTKIISTEIKNINGSSELNKKIQKQVKNLC